MAIGRPLLLVLAALLVSGCAVGYVAHRPAPEPAAPSAPDWSGLRFRYQGPPEARFPATHLLRTRYQVVDVRLAAGEPDPGAFLLTCAAGPTQDANALLLVSFFTFAVVPGYGRTREPLTFTLVAPDGASFEQRGTRDEHVVSWAPFLLFAPTLFVGMNGGEEGARGSLEAREAALEVFLRAAEPFVQAHRRPAEARP